MGVLNVTPDSFSDGGRYADAGAAVAAGLAMVADGASIVDVGGESTRPGATPVDAADELARVLPVVAGLARAGVCVSIDTMKAAVARAAVAAGARIVNDVWGLQRDPAMAGVVADTGVEVVVMHNRVAVDPAVDIVSDMLGFFERSLSLAAQVGVMAERIILDPGIGFGKDAAQSMAALRAVPRLVALGHRVLVGASRKRVIGHMTGRALEDRLAGTLAAHVLAVRGGASIVRVHDVAAHVDALAVEALLR